MYGQNKTSKEENEPNVKTGMEKIKKITANLLEFTKFTRSSIE